MPVYVPLASTTNTNGVKSRDRPPSGVGSITGPTADGAGPTPSGAESLADLTGADDLKAIEALSGIGFAKRTAANVWGLFASALTDGDFGDILISGGGTALTIDSAVLSSFGRTLLDDTTAAAARATLGAGTSSFSGAFVDLTGKPTTLAGYGISDAQPSDADLTAIAALTTLAFGRSLLTAVDAAAGRSLLGAGTSSFAGTFAALTGKPTTLAGYAITDAQGLDAELTALAGLTSAADKLPYFTGSGTAAAADFTATARTLLDDSSTAAMRTTLGLAIGTNVQAWDGDLDAIAALTTTAFGRGLLTEASAATARATLGAGTSSFSGAFSALTGIPTTLAGYGITDAQALDADLTAIAALSTTTFGRSLLTQADAAATRATIGAGTSSFSGAFSALTGIPTTRAGYGLVDAQGLDTELTALAGLVSAADSLPYFTGSGTAALATFSAFARTFVDDVDAATVRATIGAGTSSFAGTFAALTAKPTTLAGYGITDAAANGLATGSGLTMATARILGRTTAATGAIEELTVGTSLALGSGSLNTIQGIRTADSPTFTGLTTTAAAGLGDNSFITASAAQFPAGFTVRESTHATSRRAGLAVGQWTLFQDLAGSGLRSLDIYDGIAAASRFKIDTSGNVSLSSTTQSTTTANGALISAGGLGLAKNLNIGGIGISADSWRATNGSIISQITYDVGVGVFGTSSAHPLVVWTSSIERLRIDTSGNVGIGVTPTVRLHVGTTAGQIAVFDSSNASGGYATWRNSGSSIGDWGSGSQVISGGALGDFAITSRSGSLVFGTASTQRAVIDPSGYIGLGHAASTVARVIIGGPGTTNGTYPLIIRDSADVNSFYVRDDGFIAIPKIGSWTTALAANLYTDGTGIYKSTSSLRYKSNVRDYTRGLEDLLNLRPVWFNGQGKEKDVTFAGFIAEEVHAVGLLEYVAFDADGRPDGVHYAHLTALLTSSVKELDRRLRLIETKSTYA